MAQFGTVITNIGLAKITNAQITQETVGIQHMVLGDGNGGYYTLSQSQTSLRREVWRGLIADEQRDPSNPNRIAFSAYIPSTAGGFTIREVGLLDTEGNLIAVSLYPEQYKPQLAEGVSDDLLLHFVLETSNASVVTLAVDPTIIIASRAYVDKNIAEVDDRLTKHLDETFTQRLYVQRDGALAGQQTVSGFTDKPKFLLIDAFVSMTKKFCNGRVGENYQYRISRLDNDNMTASTNNSILIGDNGNDFMVGTVTINNDDTITITWSKGGNGITGTVEIYITAFYHGGVS